MEDIDIQRSKRELGESLLDDLEWLGFEWDEGPRVGGPESTYWQSERQTYYGDVLEHFASEKLIYPCFCNRTRLHSIASAPHVGEVVHRYDGHCRHLEDKLIKEFMMSKEPSLRLAVNSCDIDFVDRWKGFQHIHLEGELDDYVLRRGDGMYAYNLAVVLDEQIYLYKTLQTSFKSKNIQLPSYGHAPLLIDSEGHRLSKRQKSITIRELRENQWSPNRILGELAIVGGLVEAHTLSRREISLSELIEIDLNLPSLSQKAIEIEIKE
ncbi:MAG: glutamate--tRNA ligase family protein [Veillonella sp.]|nr:glutamate--tRNA ligase family protein [Veillonella sp.]